MKTKTMNPKGAKPHTRADSRKERGRLVRGLQALFSKRHADEASALLISPFLNRPLLHTTRPQFSRRSMVLVAFACLPCSFCGYSGENQALGPSVDEQQLPQAMHSRMQERPTITVGLRDGDIAGADNRALQAAVDYIAGLGGGVVQIGEGEFLMRDSLHLRSFVTVRGLRGKTILRKAKAATSPLKLDGDYGEEQITLANPEGFKPGYGVAIWDAQSGGFHTTVARIIGQNGNTFALDKPLNADCMVANKAQAATVFPVVSGYNLEGHASRTSCSMEIRMKTSRSMAVAAAAFSCTAPLPRCWRVAWLGILTAMGSVSSSPMMF